MNYLFYSPSLAKEVGFVLYRLPNGKEVKVSTVANIPNCLIKNSDDVVLVGRNGTFVSKHWNINYENIC